MEDIKAISALFKALDNSEVKSLFEIMSKRGKDIRRLISRGENV
jgi:hypothetical protein